MLLLTLALGCSRTVQTLDNLTTVTDRQTSSADGVATFEIEVAEGERAFLFSATSDSGLLAVESLNDPDGYPVLRWEDWYYGPESLTYAVFAEGQNTALNWPIRADEGSLRPGTWSVTVGTYKNNLAYEGGIEVEAVTQLKQDPSLSDGLIHVQIRYADGVGSDAVVTEATEEAVALWEEIYAEAGLSLSVDYGDADIDATLDYPGYDDGSLGDVSAEGTDYDITIIIGETIDGSMDYYGVSGGIPGTLVATSTSVVVMSWLVHAGMDGSFSDLDLETYAGTLAHEVGHYVGLFHVVETDYAAWDAIGDTPQCDNWSDCEDTLGPNLMYPVSVCNDDWTECIQQTELSDGQGGVIHRYTGTL